MTLQTLQAKSDYDAARASLAKVAKGSDANAASAKRALAAMDEAEPPKDDEEKEPEGEEPDGDEPKTEDDEEKDPDAEGAPAAPAASDEPPDEGGSKKKTAAAAAAAPAAAAASQSTELKLATRVHKLEAAAAARDEAEQRKLLLAKRPDFGPELRAALAKAPLETVREMVKTLPKGKVPTPRTAAITTVAAARGAGNGPIVATAAPASEGEDLDRRMGLRGVKFGCKREGNALVFGLVQDDVAEQQAPPPAAAAK